MPVAKKIEHVKYGEPLQELEIVDEQIPDAIKPGEAHVRVLYSPVNPSDVMLVRGTYGVLQPLPAVPGLEGVGEVIKGTTLQPGDRVLVRKQGVWRQEVVVQETDLVKVPKELPVEAAATLIVNPCTAYM